MKLSDINWLHLGTTAEYAKLKHEVAHVCRDVTRAGQIDEVCVNDIVQVLKINGFEVVGPTHRLGANGECTLTEFNKSDYVTHHGDWEQACRIAMQCATSEDDRAYWQRQLATLDRLANEYPRRP